ncbi:MAG: AbiH family protein [Pseudomonadota bacterium]|nr:AbiH family protein [Pseudomonadota bacterium]
MLSQEIYTSTFSGFYEQSSSSLEKHYYFLHGQAGNPNKKIVLGIDDIDDRLLVDYGLYGFLKYHQKLMNDTDYLFLSHDREVSNIAEGSGGELEIYVWGHSMDASDGDYVKEIFDFDENFVSVKVFYFGSAKFELLANLLKIVGREKIERWMKKGSLKFEKVPDLYELNFAKQTVEHER